MLISEVKPGDTIKERGKGIEVTKIERNACSSRGVHINGKYCYESGAQVSVTRPRTEASVSDMEYDEILEFISENSPFSDKALFDRLERQTVGSR